MVEDERAANGHNMVHGRTDVGETFYCFMLLGDEVSMYGKNELLCFLRTYMGKKDLSGLAMLHFSYVIYTRMFVAHLLLLPHTSIIILFFMIL